MYRVTIPRLKPSRCMECSSRALRELAAGFEQLVEAAADLELVEPTERGQLALAGTPALAAVFHQLKVGVALVDFLGEEHGSLL